uniref:Uncharacterized protein n=1 Tax=Trichuris muris TaxID=70415 RepID=A0A5S6Q9G5_TRIMR
MCAREGTIALAPIILFKQVFNSGGRQRSSISARPNGICQRAADPLAGQSFALKAAGRPWRLGRSPIWRARFDDDPTACAPPTKSNLGTWPPEGRRAQQTLNRTLHDDKSQMNAKCVPPADYGVSSGQSSNQRQPRRPTNRPIGQSIHARINGYLQQAPPLDGGSMRTERKADK